MAFTINDESRNQAPNILNFGQCVMAPEVVVSANVMRNGGNVRETIVQPRYSYVDTGLSCHEEHLPQPSTNPSSKRSQQADLIPPDQLQVYPPAR